jgi:SAM-dependent methyltransferase
MNMKPDYKNWMPKGMIGSFAAGAAVSLALTLIVGANWLKILLLILTFVFAGVTVWTELMYRAFSYDGKRQMSRQIIDGVAEYVKLPEGGQCLDVGCGSGALTIAVAKRNPQGTVTGIDR